MRREIEIKEVVNQLNSFISTGISEEEIILYYISYLQWEGNEAVATRYRKLIRAISPDKHRTEGEDARLQWTTLTQLLITAYERARAEPDQAKREEADRRRAEVIRQLQEAYEARKPASFQGMDLSNLDLAGLFFAGYLRSTSFKEIPERGAMPANLSYARLRSSDLSDANLNGVELTGADLDHATLYCAKLNRAILERANLCNADLRGADLRDANLSDANLSGANLSNADLRGAHFRGAILNNVILTAKRDESAVFYHQIQFTTAEFKQFLDNGLTDFNHLNLDHINFAELSDEQIMKINFEDVSINAKQFKELLARGRRDFTGVDLFVAGENLSHADLQGIILRKARIHSDYYHNTDLSYANLSDADLSGATFNHVSFDNAVLNKTNFKDASLDSYVSFCGANLKDSNIEEASSLSGVVLVDHCAEDRALPCLFNTAQFKRFLNAPNYAGRQKKFAGLDLSSIDFTKLSDKEIKEVELEGVYLSDEQIKILSGRWRRSFVGVHLLSKNLSDVNLFEVLLCRVDLSDADMRGANLSRAELDQTNLEHTDLRGAILKECRYRVESPPHLNRALILGNNPEEQEQIVNAFIKKCQSRCCGLFQDRNFVAEIEPLTVEWQAFLIVKYVQENLDSRQAKILKQTLRQFVRSAGTALRTQVRV